MLTHFVIIPSLVFKNLVAVLQAIRSAVLFGWHTSTGVRLRLVACGVEGGRGFYCAFSQVFFNELCVAGNVSPVVFEVSVA